MLPSRRIQEAAAPVASSVSVRGAAAHSKLRAAAARGAHGDIVLHSVECSQAATGMEVCYPPPYFLHPDRSSGCSFWGTGEFRLGVASEELVLDSDRLLLVSMHLTVVAMIRVRFLAQTPVHDDFPRGNGSVQKARNSSAWCVSRCPRPALTLR